MIPAKRQQSILTALHGRQIVSITELMEMFQVSHMTVRRDIQKLEQEGRVLSVTGGVQLAEKITSEPSHLAKRALQYAEKTGIAQAAAELVRPGMALYLDAGTTALALAEHLAEMPDLLIVSNDLDIVDYFVQHSECRVYHTGGQVLRANRSCVGDSAAQFLRNMNVDISFLSASSWNARWVSTPTESKVPVKQAAAEAAAQRVLICDSSKYGKIGTFNAVRIDELNMVITDAKLPESARAAIRQRGVKLRLVETRAEDGGDIPLLSGS